MSLAKNKNPHDADMLTFLSVKYCFKVFIFVFHKHLLHKRFFYKSEQCCTIKQYLK